MKTYCWELPSSELICVFATSVAAPSVISANSLVKIQAQVADTARRNVKSEKLESYESLGRTAEEDVIG